MLYGLLKRRLEEIKYMSLQIHIYNQLFFQKKFPTGLPCHSAKEYLRYSKEAKLSPNIFDPNNWDYNIDKGHYNGAITDRIVTGLLLVKFTDVNELEQQPPISYDVIH
jgi:hypothetical protein